jgi:Uri superfamily endonuclease
MNLEDIPRLPGSYALLLRTDRWIDLSIGRLGAFTFPPAHYLYFGSAWGPGGLQARLRRHILGASRLHWHIDTLRAAAELEIAYFLPVSQRSAQPVPRLECLWSQAFAESATAYIPVPGFGSSDCRQGCKAHLVGLTVRPASIAAALAQSAEVSGAAVQAVTTR